MLKFYKIFIYLSFLFLLGFLWAGCNIINPAEQVPTYVHIDSFIFKPNGINKVTTASITNVWVYYNNNPVGSFDLPATVPIITTGGSGGLELSPGIVIDGLNNLLGTYPFYEIDTSTLITNPGKVLNYTPHTEYFSDVVSTSFITPGNPGFALWRGDGNVSMAPMITSNVDSIEEVHGTPVALIALTPVFDSSIDSSSIPPFAIPSGSAFIELDYKSDVPITVGLQANVTGVISSTPYYLTGIYPSATWQKFYLSVADFAAQFKGNTYNLYIRAVLPPGQPSGLVLLSNIQVVSF